MVLSSSSDAHAHDPWTLAPHRNILRYQQKCHESCAAAAALQPVQLQPVQLQPMQRSKRPRNMW
jgi:hypothetical protein